MDIIGTIKETVERKFIIKKYEDIAYEWLEYKKNQIKESTYYNYKFIIEKYLITQFYNKKLTKMRDFNTFVDELSTNLSPKTIRDIINVFKSTLSYYEENYNKKLKYKKIVLPKQEKKEVEVFTSREKDKLENYCINQNTLKTLGIIMCLNTGMRLGELCALKWKNLDLTEKNIYIRETAQRVYKGKNVKSKIIIDTPKTKCSIRVIPINSKLYTILNQIKSKYQKEAFFLTGSVTKCIEPRNYQNFFKKTLTKCKIKEHNFHATRHTFASNCVEVGMDIKTLSKILRTRKRANNDEYICA